jgi:hypothetical protein
LIYSFLISKFTTLSFHLISLYYLKEADQKINNQTNKFSYSHSTINKAIAKNETILSIHRNRSNLERNTNLKMG